MQIFICFRQSSIVFWGITLSIYFLEKKGQPKSMLYPKSALKTDFFENYDNLRFRKTDEISVGNAKKGLWVPENNFAFPFLVCTIH